MMSWLRRASPGFRFPSQYSMLSRVTVTMPRYVHLTTANISDEMVRDAIELYSQRKPSAFSISQFLEFSRRKDEPDMALLSAQTLVHELPIRVAHMIRIFERLPKLFRDLPHVQKGHSLYRESMRTILAMRSMLHQKGVSEEDLVDMSLESAQLILDRHAPIVSIMASGLQYLYNENRVKEIPSYERFLNQLFMCRIGTRLCVTQHINLFSGRRNQKKHQKPVAKTESEKADCFGRTELQDHPTHGRIARGVFVENMDLQEIIEEAAESAKILCLAKYGEAPEVKVVGRYQAHKDPKTGHIQRKSVDSITFSYVPSHIYHVLFEMFKNSMRATAEISDLDSDAELPVIRVILVKADNDLTIKIEDRGGGVPQKKVRSLFRYAYTDAAPKPIDPGEGFRSESERPPMSGFGYGLPMSRLYCRYFGGDLRLVSTEGYGVDSSIYLKSMDEDAKETLTLVGTEKEETHFLTRTELVQELLRTRKKLEDTKAKLEHHHYYAPPRRVEEPRHDM
eukprot:gb/GEZN01004677.1/.p1 GENE.gb/GEZN01004677.1/~~gb/GEZN01004677.1/.p1  ORF type:complete len:525 (+),score=34.98 gb/GEZN01004677.1/:49-1575(+)